MLPSQVKDFIYLDVDGIDLLYSQTVDRIEVKQTSTKSNSLSGKVGITGKLKSLFVAFLGQAELNASAEASGTRGASTSKEEIHSTYNKLKELVESLEHIEFGVCFSSLYAAAKYSLQHSQKVFFCGSHKFDAPQFFDGPGAHLVTESGYLLLSLGDRYIESDDYYKHGRFRADMSCSILKMPRSQSGMAISGHDAIFFRGFKGTDVPLSTFCSVIPLREMVQLKPYALWI